MIAGDTIGALHRSLPVNSSQLKQNKPFIKLSLTYFAVIWIPTFEFRHSELQYEFRASELNPNYNCNSKTITNSNATVNHNRKFTVKSETQ